MQCNLEVVAVIAAQKCTAHNNYYAVVVHDYLMLLIG